ncbi:hypothetical protein MSPP1_000141 [Malassezia sp. CBS 17886]|nr:hypothetical protein MSPP1_000141 [Malassezia sp. CBS 17886]
MSGNAQSGALARTLMGSLALLFQRPVRLFRPMQFSSFSLIELMAHHEGKKLGIPYLRRLVKNEKPSVLFSLVAPPLLANMAIGFTLFQTYTVTEYVLLACTSQGARAERSFTPLPIVAVAGAAAGAAQCIISVPLDNMRLVVQRVVLRDATKWPRALLTHNLLSTWAAVLRAAVLPFLPQQLYARMMQQLHRPAQTTEPKTATVFRHVPLHARLLSRRVHGITLVLSLMRDSLGFSCFFTTFELARRTAFSLSQCVDRAVHSVRHYIPTRERADREPHSALDFSFDASRTVFARVAAALVLVFGGAAGSVLYDLVSRPIEFVRMVLWHSLYVSYAQRAPGAQGNRASGSLVNMPPARRSASTYAVRASIRRLRTLRQRVPPAASSSAPSATTAPTRHMRRVRVHARLHGGNSISKLMRYARLTQPPGPRQNAFELFVNTFLARPYLHPELCRAAAPRPWGAAPPAAQPPARGGLFPWMSPEKGTLGSRLALQTARVYGPWGARFGQRAGWFLNRIMSPYGCAFLVFAWMGGDLGRAGGEGGE